MMFFLFSALSALNATGWAAAVHYGLGSPQPWVTLAVWVFAHFATLFCFALGMAAKEAEL